MPEWIFIILFLALGIVLVVLEIVLLPGGIVGIIGAIFMSIAIFLSFTNYGSDVGITVTLITGVIFVSALIYGFKTDLWSKVALNTTNTGRVFETEDIKVVVGDTGRALSALRPIGKAEFKDSEIEVRSMGEYVDSGEKIKIIMIKDDKVYVEKTG